MRRIHLVVFALLSWTWVLASGALAPAGSPADVLYVRCGTLIADASTRPMSSASIIITDGKITAMGRSLPVPTDAHLLDLSSYTVIPGLIDAHIHLWTGSGGADPPSDALAALRASQAMRYALISGVIAARVLGLAADQGFIDVALEKAIDEHIIMGPHLIPAGHAITIPGGHGDWWVFPASMPLASLYTPLHGFVNSPADAERAVHLQIKYGARVIKMYGSGGIGSPLDSYQAEQLSTEEMRVVVEQAHMANVKVAVHAENLRTILDALHAGVDSIEHGSELNQEAVNYMKAHHIVLVPTVYAFYRDLNDPKGEQENPYEWQKAKEIAKTEFPSFELAARAGVTIAAGSDQLYKPGGPTVQDEMITEVKYGFTPQQALNAATRNGAALLGLNDVGILAVGKEGDLVALDGNPLADIHAIKKVKSVVFEGRVALSPDGVIHQ